MAKKKRGAPQKECPRCKTVQHARRSLCSRCGFDFLAKKTVTVKKKVVRRKKKVAVAATVKKVVKRRKKRRGRPAAAAGGGGGSFSLGDITSAKALVAQIGGTSKTKKLLDVLS